MATKPTKTESLMRIRARRRICEVLEEQLVQDTTAESWRGAPWVEALIAQGVERRIIDLVAQDIGQKLRGIARSAKP